MGVPKRWSGIEGAPSKKPGIMVNACISMCNKSKCEEVLKTFMFPSNSDLKKVSLIFHRHTTVLLEYFKRTAAN